jgi:hypothetical protein
MEQMKGNGGFMGLKLDMTKAFNQMEWSFILKIFVSTKHFFDKLISTKHRSTGSTDASLQSPIQLSWTASPLVSFALAEVLCKVTPFSLLSSSEALKSYLGSFLEKNPLA